VLVAYLKTIFSKPWYSKYDDIFAVLEIPRSNISRKLLALSTILPFLPCISNPDGLPYSVRREHYRRDPWYVMVKKGKDSIYIVLREL
jgi:hypothetical protein